MAASTTPGRGAKLGSLGRGGTKSAAEPVGFTVLLGFVVLLAVFLESMVAGDGFPELVRVFARLGRLSRFLRGGCVFLLFFEESRSGLGAVLAFRVILGTLVFSIVLWHLNSW